MHFTNFTPHEFDRALPDGQQTANTISCITNPTARSRVQRAAYLLGASRNMPELTRGEINHHLAVQLCYSAMNSGFVIDPSLQSRKSSPYKSPEIDPCKL